MEIAQNEKDYGTYYTLSTFDDFNFTPSKSEIPTDDKKYLPIFAVGGIDETRMFCITARPLKMIPEAIKYYGLSSIDDYDGMKDKIVGIIKRKKVDGEKINEYHCVEYKLKEIVMPHMYSLSYAVVECLETNETMDINIDRVTIPSLIQIKTLPY